MPNGNQTVRPGDVISADRWNQLVARVQALENAAASADDALTITGLIPASGPYQIGSTLTILGRGFQHSLGAARVFLDSVQVLTLSPGSSDTQLILVIPPVPGVTQAGTSVTLRVNNQTEQVSQQIVLRPAPVALFGDVQVDWLSVDPTTIQPDQPATFRFRISSGISEPAEFLIDPQITVAAAQSLWQSRLQVLDAALSPIPSRLIPLGRTDTRIFHVRITSVPSGTDGTTFELTVGASADGVIGSSGTLDPFQVGQPVEPPDNTIQLDPTGSTPSAALVGNTVTASPNQLVRVRFAALFQVPGTYDVLISPDQPTQGWTVGPWITTPAEYVIDAADIDSQTGTASRIPEITIQPTAGASSPFAAELRLQRQGETNSKARSLELILGT